MKNYLTIGRYPAKSLLITALGFISICAAFIWGFQSFSSRPFIVDEYHHFAQFNIFFNWELKMTPELTTIPGYHFVLAILGKLLGSSEFSTVRSITTSLSFLSVFIFYLAAKEICKEEALIKTLQFTFLPILFPFFFLIYTDVFSLTLVVAALFFFESEKRNLGYLSCIASVFLRQSNIIWLLFFFVYVYITDYSWRLDRKNLLRHCKESYLALFGFVLFACFITANGGVSMGHQDFHPSFSLHSGNIFFCLFTVFCLFFPIFISQWRQSLVSLRRWKVSLPLLAGTVVLFACTFKADNPLNSFTNHLRNALLQLFTRDDSLKLSFLIICILSLIGLMGTKLWKKQYSLLYPATALFLAPSWLIEQRYYLIPISFFLLFRKTKSKATEILMTLMFAAASYYLTISILKSDNFFL